MSQHASTSAPAHPPVGPEGRPGSPRIPLFALLFVGAFALLLASFVNRTGDLWGHLVAGREVVAGPTEVGPTWLYDLVVYALYSALGGAGLVFVKAVCCAAGAVLVLDACRRSGGVLVPLAVTGLAVLAAGTRLFLQPATVSVMFLALVLWWPARSDDRSAEERAWWWPGWRLVVLFAVWGNVDGRFVLGLVAVALVWLGKVADGPTPGGFWRDVGRRAVRVAVLAAAGCASPEHVNNLRVPPELRAAVAALRSDAPRAGLPPHSPFAAEYLAESAESPAALACIPLLLLGPLSFALNRKGFRAARLLPWLGFALAAAVQVRLVPFFAVVAAPVTARNLVEFFARRTAAARPRPRAALRALTGALAVAFVVAAWPGWLQGPPFGPRRWGVERPPAAEAAAAFLGRARASGLWPADAGTLYPAADTAAAVGWFDAADRRVRDDAVVRQLLAPDQGAAARTRLRELRVGRVVVSAADRAAGSLDLLGRLLADPDEWPVLHLAGGVAVFGWRDPAARASDPDPYAGWEVDFDRLAFAPDEADVAPPGRAAGDRRWWEAFRTAAPAPHPPERDEAVVLLKKAEAMIASAPRRHLALWTVGEMSATVGAAGGWLGPAGRSDAALRLALLEPPLVENAPPPPITQLVFGLQQEFVRARGQAPVGVLYASIRASRRALAKSPDDAGTYFVLGQTYLALVRTSAELNWARRLPQLMRLRQLQAVAALNRAVALNPNLADAHYELAGLYLSFGYLDLAAGHLRAYRDAVVRSGGPVKGDRRAEQALAELDRVTQAVAARTQEFAGESARLAVGDRAALALERQLAGAARDLLLKSDVSAFGTPGLEMELDLLLKTGRPEDVLAWVTPEMRGAQGDFAYYWVKAQANCALGEYAAADAEFGQMIGPGGRPPEQVAADVGVLLGKALLDRSPGAASAPRLAIQTLTDYDFRTAVARYGTQLGRLSDVLVLRGLVALEAGDVAGARAAFRAALAYSPSRWGDGRLEFNGRWVAWECLGLLDGAAALPPRAAGR